MKQSIFLSTVIVVTAIVAFVIYRVRAGKSGELQER